MTTNYTGKKKLTKKQIAAKKRITGILVDERGRVVK